MDKIIPIGERLRRIPYDAPAIRAKVSQLTTSNAAHFALAAMLVAGLAATGGLAMSKRARQADSDLTASNGNEEFAALKQRLMETQVAAAQAEAKLRAFTAAHGGGSAVATASPVSNALTVPAAMAPVLTPAQQQREDRLLKLQAENQITARALETVKADRDQLRAKLDQVQKAAAVQAEQDRQRLEQMASAGHRRSGAKAAEARFRLAKAGRAAPHTQEASAPLSGKAAKGKTGFNIHNFLARLGVRAPAEGGPYVALRGKGQADPKVDPAAEKILRSLPLRAPLDHYRLESRFGARVDPIDGEEAFHTGLDMSGPYRTPVFNTAPGTVVYAGYAGSYGRLVEIDHGHGIHTKYAHLNRIMVNVGQHLKPHTKIGLLGSTGRSTGPHVHYEVTVNGTAEDPARFLNAGRLLVSKH